MEAVEFLLHVHVVINELPLEQGVVRPKNSHQILRLFHLPPNLL